jgi:hypothetical protein
MIRILLNAAYKKNYDGVENILAKSSLLQQCPDKYLHYCFDTNEKGREKIIEIYRLSTKYYQANKEFTYKRDEKLYLLLKKYGVQKPHIFDVALWTAVVNKNIMACLAGDSDAITKKDNASFIKKQRIKIAFEVAVSCNNIKCIKKCLEIAQAYKDDHCVHDVFAVNPECVALENEYTKLFDEMYAIIQKYPHLHVIIDDWKDKTAITTLKKLDQERQMTFLELVCTIC